MELLDPFAAGRGAVVDALGKPDLSTDEVADVLIQYLDSLEVEEQNAELAAVRQALDLVEAELLGNSHTPSVGCGYEVVRPQSASNAGRVAPQRKTGTR